MSVIRPAPSPLPTVRPGGAVAQAPVSAAQRAFFQTALDQAGVEAPRAAGPEPRRAEARPIDRLPRPGSLLDIRV